jgi:hypothetical protein
MQFRVRGKRNGVGVCAHSRIDTAWDSPVQLFDLLKAENTLMQGGAHGLA